MEKELFIGQGIRGGNLVFPQRLILAITKEEAQNKLAYYYKENNIKVDTVVIYDTLK